MAMLVDFINPFLEAAYSVFSTMLSCSLQRQAPFILGDRDVDFEISGCVGLSGKAMGTVVLSLHREVALSAAAAMLGTRPKTIDADVVDAIGELTNMIAGSAKARLEQYAMSLSLPNVIVGPHHMIKFPSHSTPICIPFECEWGSLCLTVGLVETPKTAEPARREAPVCAV
jgi:chemotaxis protein CheX